MGFKVQWRSWEEVAETLLSPTPQCTPQVAGAAGLGERALRVSVCVGSPARPPWAGRHWLAGTVPSGRGVPAAWWCLRRERGRHGDRVCAAPRREVLPGRGGVWGGERCSRPLTPTPVPGRRASIPDTVFCDPLCLEGKLLRSRKLGCHFASLNLRSWLQKEGLGSTGPV